MRKSTFYNPICDLLTSRRLQSRFSSLSPCLAVMRLLLFIKILLSTEELMCGDLKVCNLQYNKIWYTVGLYTIFYFKVM